METGTGGPTPQPKISLDSIPPMPELADVAPELQATAKRYVQRARRFVNSRIKARNRRYFEENAPAPVDPYHDPEKTALVGRMRDECLGPLDAALSDEATVARFKDGSIEDREDVKLPVLESVRNGSLGLLVAAAALGDNNTKPMIEYRDYSEKGGQWRFMSYGQVDEYTNRLAVGP